MYNEPIYFDNHSTTKLDPRVLDAMMPFFTMHYGNSSSQHYFGYFASEAVSIARKKVASLLNANDDEIIFTSGATESNNLVLKGIVESYRSQGNHIITSKIEHSSVIDVCKKLEQKGISVTYLSVDRDGNIDLEELKNSITEKTILVSIMFGNNEIGTIAPIKEIVNICHSSGILFHTDATQCAGNIKLDIKELGIDLLSFSAHKLHGPKGIGALYVKSTTPKILLSSQIDGGGHEKNIRSGTLNVPAIIGFGKAAEICKNEMQVNSEFVLRLRNKFEENMENVSGVTINGNKLSRLPNNSHLTIQNVKIKDLIRKVKGVVFSTHAACSSSDNSPSHVLNAIGMNKENIDSSARFGFCRMNTEEEVISATNIFTNAINELRNSNNIIITQKQNINN
ncbi:MAG: cysteine desulfurase [Ignavibacteria bacterium]|nr:cysteine desulfurase [Bacteroidota bacterium]MSQ46096.1 cysteine desulfurase [Ignavibacteria bacterium]